MIQRNYIKALQNFLGTEQYCMLWQSDALIPPGHRRPIHHLPRSPPLASSLLNTPWWPGFISVDVINTLMKSSLREKGVNSAYNSTLQPIVMEKSERQELEAASFITFTVKTREKQMHPCYLLAIVRLTFFTEQCSCLGNGAAHSELDLPTSINYQVDPLQNAHRSALWRQLLN